MEIRKYKILISDSIAKEGIDYLKSFPNFEVDVKTKHTKQELIEMVPSYHAIIIRSATKLDADVIAAAENLRVIARAGTGYDNIDIEACNKKGIVVMITPTGNSNAVIELTFGLMLDHARNIGKANNLLSQGKWEKKALEGYELKGKTIGIIGFGRIGAGVAKRAKAFEMNVLTHDKYVPKAYAEEMGAKLIENVDDLLKQADYITLHIPLTDETKNLINEEKLKLMKPNVVIVNVARGGIVDEKALVKALDDNKIGGACFDVFTKEPAIKEDIPLIGHPKVVCTPHLGASTYEAQIEVAKLAAEHIAQALNSDIYIDAVNLPFRLNPSLAEVFKPYMKLANYMGKILTQYRKGRIEHVLIEYKGDLISQFDSLRAVLLYSFFSKRFADTVTYMNLEEILAQNKISVTVEKITKRVNYETVMKMTVIGTEGKSVIAGTVFSERPKIIEIDDQYMDVEPSEYMLILKSIDRPGVIGMVGTFLGQNGINIAGWQLGRKAVGGDALSVITLDNLVSPEIIEKLKKLENIKEAYFIQI